MDTMCLEGYACSNANQVQYLYYLQTIAACHHYASYRSSSNFTFPHAFLPERWLGLDSRFEQDKKDVLQPFSLGPRNCLGKKYVLSTTIQTDILTMFYYSLAYCEIRLILCKLLYHFDLTLCPESSTWTNQKVYFLWDKPPLMVTLKDRFQKTEEVSG